MRASVRMCVSRACGRKTTLKKTKMLHPFYSFLLFFDMCRMVLIICIIELPILFGPAVKAGGVY